MRAGWNRYLRDYLWAADPKAQLIAEAIVVEREDVKDLRSDWNGADGALSPDFELLDRGGIKLAAGTDTAVDFSGATDVDITTLGPGASFSAVVISWTGVGDHEKEIQNVVLRVDPDTGAGRNVDVWICRLYRVRQIGPEEGRIDLDYIGEQAVEESGSAVHNITFNFVRDGWAPVVGPGPILGTDEYGRTSEAQPSSYPMTVVALFAYQSDGTPATAVAWRGVAGAAAASGTGWSAAHSLLQEMNDPTSQQSNAGTGGAFFQNGATNFPFIQLNQQDYAATGTVTFTTNKLDLGGVPSGSVQVIAQGEEPGDSELVWEISDDGGANWYECSDGDYLATNNTSSGHDLSAVGLQQEYSVRVTLNASTDLQSSPVARRLGVQEVTLTDLVGAAVVRDCSWKVDPVTLKGEVGQPMVSILKTGERDYRDYFTTLFSTSHIGQVQIRLWVGHPDLERRYWLHLDTYDVEDTIPGDSQGTAVCLSVLGRLRAAGTIPLFDEGPNTRTAVAIQDTIAGVYDELLDSQIALDGRLRGPGISDSFSDTISKTLKESDAKDELDAVAYLAGHSVISSQGRIKAVQMMEDQGSERPAVAWFPRAEVRPVHLAPGFTNRIDEFFVPFGWDDGLEEFESESRAVWNVGFDSKLRSRGLESRSDLEEETARWIEDATLADKVALRTVTHFATGLMLWEIEATYPHPYLEPGDVVVVQTDQFVGIDPVTDRQVRGVVSAKGTVVEVHDAMGRHFVVWVKSFADIIAGEELIDRVGYVRPEFLNAEAVFGADGSLVLRGFINIPGGSVRAVDHGAAFQTEGTTRAASATAATDGYFEYTLAPAGTYDKGENAFITAFAYETAAGSGAESRPMLALKGQNQNDADTDAEVTAPIIGFTDDGSVIATTTADDDAAAGTVFWTVGFGVAPADPDNVTNDGGTTPGGVRSLTVTFDGTGGFATKQADMGEMVFVKVVAYNAAGVMGPVVMHWRRRGDAEFVPPRGSYEVSKSGTTVTVVVNFDDPSLALTALEFNERPGTEGATAGGWVTTWDSSTGTLGTNTAISRTEAVTVEGGVDGDFLFRHTWTDEKGASKTRVTSVPLANLQDTVGYIEISFADLMPVNYATNNEYACTMVGISPSALFSQAAGTQVTFAGGVTPPKGVNFTECSSRVYKAAAGDLARCDFYFRDASDLLNSITSLEPGATTGWSTQTDSSPSHTTQDGTYILEVALRGAAAGEAAFGSFRIEYDRPSIKRVL